MFINLTEDPGLYEVWNRAIRLSTARYLSSANIDDRRDPDQLTELLAVLDGDPTVDVCKRAPA